MRTDAKGSGRGRAREAALNDPVIHHAVRRVLARDPNASIADIAAAAGVGRSALYLRYPSKEMMLQRVAHDATEGLVVIIEHAHESLDRGEDPGGVLRSFLESCVDADTHGFLIATAGSFTPSDDDVRLSRAGFLRGRELVARWHAAGVLRDDVDWNDLNDWTMAVSRLGSYVPGRANMRQHRMLAALLPGLAPGHESLPGTHAVSRDYWPADVPGFADRDDVE